MSTRDRLIVLFNICFILLFSFLILAQCHIDRQMRKLEAVQSEINRANYERNERMDQELRLLSQDVRIHNNILLFDDYEEESE